MRGEKQREKGKRGEREGSPPRARGKEAEAADWDDDTGITPACAGKRPRPLQTNRSRWDHPRVRGEKVTP